MNSHLKKQLTLVLKLTCIFLFLGRAWQHLVWDIPIRSFLWDQELMEGIITSLTNMTWFEYATHETQDMVIEGIKRSLGVFYLVCALIVPFVHEKRNWTKWFLLASSFFLTALALLYYKEKFLHLGQLFEYSSQIISPILLYMLLFTRKQPQILLLIGNMTIALTFTCHGLYALGYYPQPGLFVDMMINSLYIDEPTARILLKIFGVLDIVVSIGIFIPRVARASLIYAVVWGGLTAFARVYANFYFDFPWQSLNQWLPEMLYRIPHSLIPFFILKLYPFALSGEEQAIGKSMVVE